MAESPEKVVEVRAITGRHMRRRIDRMLESRMTREGTRSRSIEDSVKKAGAYSWKQIQRHPYLGTVAAGAGAIAAASSVGAAELGFGAAVAYGIFQVLTGREQPKQALEQVEHAI